MARLTLKCLLVTLAVALLSIFFLPWFGLKIRSASEDLINPFYKASDLVITKQACVEEIGVGDIIYFSRDGERFCEQVCKIEEQEGGLCLKMSGDEDKSSEHRFLALRSHKVERVIMTVPFLGIINKSLKNKLIFVSILLVIILLLLAAIVEDIHINIFAKRKQLSVSDWR